MRAGVAAVAQVDHHRLSRSALQDVVDAVDDAVVERPTARHDRRVGQLYEDQVGRGSDACDFRIAAAVSGRDVQHVGAVRREIGQHQRDVPVGEVFVEELPVRGGSERGVDGITPDLQAVTARAERHPAASRVARPVSTDTAVACGRGRRVGAA